MNGLNAIIKNGIVYEVVSYPYNHCELCELKAECDSVGHSCLADELFGCDGMPIFRFNQELTDKLNKE